MLKIFNDLKTFFEDCHRRVNVREYAKMAGVSPPTASKALSSFYEHGLLLKETYRNNLLFYANRDSRDFVDLSRMYWRSKLNPVVEALDKRLAGPTIVLFGSMSKAEATADSDIDLAVFAMKKEVDLSNLEKGLGRGMHILFFGSLKDVKNRGLAENIANGYVLSGRLGL